MSVFGDAHGATRAEVEELAAGLMRLAEPVEIGADCTCCVREVGCPGCSTPPAEPAYTWTSRALGDPQFELCVGCCAAWRELAVDPGDLIGVLAASLHGHQCQAVAFPLRIAEIDSFEGPNGERLWYLR